MAEFQEVMKQWRRMCRANERCSSCPLNNADCCISDPYLRTDVEIETLEELITNWAEEHPEQIYPTWLEWLECNDIFHRTEVYPHVYSTTVGKKAFDHIPADTAEKLGIKPKDE